jgi:lipopolysaccharide export system protein LptA
VTVATVALLAASIAGGPPAHPHGSGEPVRVDADQVRYLYAKRQVIFTGKPLVRLTQGSAVLTCRRLVATNDDAGGIAQAVCTGDVTLTRGERVVTCQTATFDNAAGRVVCEGDPVLRDGPTEARGEKLTYELATDEVTLFPATVTMPGSEVEARKRELDARRKKEAKP